MVGLKTWVERLIEEYNDGKNQLESHLHKLDLQDPDREDPQVERDRELVSGMIADMHYAIDWMRSGRRPGSRRGTEIKDAYSRAILLDMDLLPANDEEPEPELSVTMEQKRALVRVLMKLSKRERQCYLLHTAQGLSLAEIGKEMKLSKAAVQKYVDRAKSKVGQAV